MYHRFREARYDPFSLPIDEFRRQMEWIAQKGLAISLADLQAFLSRKKDLPDGSVLVTIDDGYYEVWSQALPILRRLGIPAVVFTTTGLIASDPCDHSKGGMASHDQRRLSWENLVALTTDGIVVGSHSWNHYSLGRLGRAEVRFEVNQSRKELENRLGLSVEVFAYPFGTRADFNPMTGEVLREARYECAFTAQHGAIESGADPYTLPRVKVEGGEWLWMFKLLLKGGLDSWAWIDRTLWWLQASKTSRRL